MHLTVDKLDEWNTESLPLDEFQGLVSVLDPTGNGLLANLMAVEQFEAVRVIFRTHLGNILDTVTYPPSPTSEWSQCFSQASGTQGPKV